MTADHTRRYRFPIRPGRRETLESFSARVLEANFEDPSHQRWLTQQHQVAHPELSREEAWLQLLAVKTGRKLDAVANPRFPSDTHPDGESCEFCEYGFQNRFECSLCAHGATVQQHPHAFSNVCLKHHRWVGPAATPEKQHYIGQEVLDAEIIYRKLRRRGKLDAPFYQRIRRGLSGIDQAEGNPRLDAKLYPQVISVAAALNDPAFRQRFFDPNQTFTTAYSLLGETVSRALGRADLALTRSLWLYFRPTFLDIREALDENRPYKQDAPHNFSLPRGLASSFGTPMRPLEPFVRYLEQSGDNKLIPVNYHDVTSHYAHANPGDKTARPMICLFGHRSITAAKTGRTRGFSLTDNCPYCEHREIRVGFNDLQTTHPAVAHELDPAKNGGISAREVFAGSHESFVWTCRRSGQEHDFPATASNRTANRSGCPVCMNRVIVSGVNDLGTVRPDIAAEFDREANPETALEFLAPGSNQIVSWRCSAGHTYRMSVGDRTRGGECRYCPKGARRDRTLAAKRPDLVQQLHPTRNPPHTPDTTTVGSHTELVWNCPRGHTYGQTAERRNSGYGCPYCSGQRFQVGVTDVLTLHPDLCREWHPYKNGTLRAQDRDARTRTIWWKCAKGHETQQTILLRVKSGGCAECSPESRVRSTT